MKYLMANKISGFKVFRLLLVLIIGSCTLNTQAEVTAKKQLKILSVGNSYAEDAFSYVPYILNNITDSVDLTFGILFYPGCSLETHCEFIESNSPKYE